MTLATQIVTDVGQCFLNDNDEFSEHVTIGGNQIRAIIMDDSAEGDARAPRLFVAAADVAAYSAGAVVVAGGNTYAAAGFYPDGAGGAEIQLQP